MKTQVKDLRDATMIIRPADALSRLPSIQAVAFVLLIALALAGGIYEIIVM